MAALLDLPLEVLTAVCQQLDLRDLVCFAATCKRFRHGDDGLETVELLTTSPVVTALREHAFPVGESVPNARPTGCSESWVAYLARCARQHRCREAPHIAAGLGHSLFVDADRQELECGKGSAVSHNDEEDSHSHPTSFAAMAAVRMQSVAAGLSHSFALCWDGKVYSWGGNSYGELGLGDRVRRASPTLVEGLEGVCGACAANYHSLAVTQLGDVFSWGRLVPEAKKELRPIIVEGFKEGVRVCRVFAGFGTGFAIAEDGELFSRGFGDRAQLGHGDTQDQLSPKRVEALRGVRVSSVSVGGNHVLALTEDGLVYAWGENSDRKVLGHHQHVSHNITELLPQPVEALRGVRVVSSAAADRRSYALADTGELWAWGRTGEDHARLGHCELGSCALPKVIESLRAVKLDGVTAGDAHTLALADDRSAYAWGSRLGSTEGCARSGPCRERCGEGSGHAAAGPGAERVGCGLG
jgi:alpha-tubulin suppressor-like RCC1 family protein